jgi:hypothetical protein
MGDVFAAMIALGKIFKGATKDVLIVDPYMDEVALSDFALQVLALAPLSAKAEERSAAQRGINNDPLNVYWALYRSKSADPEVRLRASELFSGIVFALGYAKRQFKWRQSSATVLPTGETLPQRRPTY